MLSYFIKRFPLEDNSLTGLVLKAGVVELADTHGLGPCAVRRGSSNLPPSTERLIKNYVLKRILKRSFWLYFLHYKQIAPTILSPERRDIILTP